jgi:hypothetical protein
MVSFNCSCDEGFYGNETLLELRTSLMERLGYAAQADDPPPGMARLLDNFLRRGQNFLYRRHRALQTERFFSWPMVVGERFYDIPDNSETCTKRLDAYKISYVGVEDLNGMWYPLAGGIPPEFYTMAAFNGLPSRYEIRQCIEVLPAPSAVYTLWVKGHFGLNRFTQDGDTTTLDSELVFLWALANAKNHYGQPDAADIATESKEYLRQLIAGSHGTRRYVPGVVDVPPMTPPIFLPLVGP